MIEETVQSDYKFSLGLFLRLVGSFKGLGVCVYRGYIAVSSEQDDR